MILIRISDSNSLRSLCIKETGESTLDKDLPVSLKHHDSSDPGSLMLIQINPKKSILTLELCEILVEIIVNTHHWANQRADKITT